MGFLIDVDFLELRTGEIPAEACLVSITEIISSCQQIGIGALLSFNNYVFGLLWGNQCFRTFDSHNKDENGDISAVFKLHSSD